MIAADLLSQAEHDPTSQSILFTDDGDFADAVATAVAHVIPTLATAATMRDRWDANGAIIVVPNLADAIPLSDRLAPEHPELAVHPPQADPRFAQLRPPPPVLPGRQPPARIADVSPGPNHVPPTDPP